MSGLVPLLISQLASAGLLFLSFAVWPQGTASPPLEVGVLALSHFISVCVVWVNSLSRWSHQGWPHTKAAAGLSVLGHLSSRHTSSPSLSVAALALECPKIKVSTCQDCIRSGPGCAWCKKLVGLHFLSLPPPLSWCVGLPAARPAVVLDHTHSSSEIALACS